MNEEMQKQFEREKIIMPLWQVLAVRRGVIRTCLNCDHWAQSGHRNKENAPEECTLAPGQRPPAIVIVYGCNSWMEEIPF